MRQTLLVQLPIPPPGPQPVEGNVPLAAAYLKLFARRRGLERRFGIEILPPAIVDSLADRGLVEAILQREPWMVGFTCYVWNIERTLWLADRLKQRRPDLRIVVGGPEITADNHWVLQRPSLDYAVIGEGEQTFAELLAALADAPSPPAPIDGLMVLPGGSVPRFRAPMKRLDEISSPYIEGILDAREEKRLLLETVRGCRFQCKFCYYPKSYDALYYLSSDEIEAQLRHAAECEVDEVVLLDPTLNQRRDFADFLRLLARHNAGRHFTYSAELRAEGITAETGRLLGEANFSEVEVGLQSVDPRAQELMGRKVNLRAFERGVRAMLDAGIRVRTDLILGLPGDTADSIRRGIDYLAATRLFTDIQVFQLAVLPGTAFRNEAESLGLKYQSRPPYYVLKTPELTWEQLYELMDEAQDAFGIEFDPFPPPALQSPPNDSLIRTIALDLDAPPPAWPPAEHWAQVLSLELRAADFDARRDAAATAIRAVVGENPHTTLEVRLKPSARHQIALETLETLRAACFDSTSYLDLYYSLHPNRLLAAKRLVLFLPAAVRGELGPEWIGRAGDFATLVWQGELASGMDLLAHEHAVAHG